jgi:hypothetical protein
MKKNKIVLWVLIIAGGIIAFSIYTIVASTHSVDDRRRNLDTTYFTGKHPGYEPVLRAAMMKTSWYQQFLATRNEDSLHIYLKLAEKEGMEAIKRRQQ